MNEVLNYALLSAINISGCDAGCLLRIMSGKRIIEFAHSLSKPSFLNYDEIIINSFDENSFELIKPENVHPKESFPVITFCKQISDERNSESKLFFIVTSSEQKTISPSIKKILKVLTDTLTEFNSSAKTNEEMLGKNPVQTDQDNLLIDLSDDLIFILDKNGKFVNVNTSCALMLEYTPDELLNHYLVDLIPSYRLNNFTKYFNELIKFNSSNPFDTSLLKMTGEEINVHLRCQVLFDGSNIRSVYGIARKPVEESVKDELNFIKNKLTENERILKIERSRVHQQKAILEELNKMKNDFISNISHEFRTPLASIIGFSETIDSEADIDEEMREEFNREILNEAKRLAKLINEVLDTSLVAGKKILLNKTSFDVIGLVKEIINENTSAIKEKQIVINQEIPSVETVIFADREKISKVISSLLKYSISSSMMKGRIKILISDFDEEIEIIITDTGYGISDADMNKLSEIEHLIVKENFTSEPFHSLVFTKQIVDLHGGLFTFDSEFSRGTSFVIKLPRIKNLKQT